MRRPFLRQLAPYRFAGPHEPRVGRSEKAEFRQQKNAGVEIGASKRARQGAAMLVPRLVEEAVPDGARMILPVFRAVLLVDTPGDLPKSRAGRPTQGGGVSVNARTAAIFPRSGVRFERANAGLFAERLQQPEQSDIPHFRQTLIDEHLRRREHHAAVDVVLSLLRGLIANPDGSMIQGTL